MQAHLELKAIRETKNPEEKKKKVMARAEAQKAKTPEQKAETARKAKEGFSIMFKAYCAEAGNAGTDVRASSRALPPPHALAEQTIPPPLPFLSHPYHPSVIRCAPISC